MTQKLNQRLHWTTTVTEKIMLGGIGGLTVVAAGFDVWDMFQTKSGVYINMWVLGGFNVCLGFLDAKPCRIMWRSFKIYV